MSPGANISRGVKRRMMKGSRWIIILGLLLASSSLVDAFSVIKQDGCSSRTRSMQLAETCLSKHDDVEGPSEAMRIHGRKRALMKKYGRAVVLSSTLMYGPIASAPVRRVFGHAAAHAASTAAKAPGEYNFEDFRDVKKKLSLIPGANVQAYEEILAKVEVEGEEALAGSSYEEKATLDVGESNEASANASSKSDRQSKRSQARAQRKKQETSDSDWGSDEFGFEDEDDDLDDGVLSLDSKKAKSGGNIGPSKANAGKSGSSSGGLVMTDRMAFNDYQAERSKDDQIKVIKKLTFYTLFPVFIITTIRGQFRAWKEKKWVKKGLAILEEDRKKYLEEKKKKKEGKGDDDGKEEI